MATTSQCRTETLFYILQLRLMNKTHTTQAGCFDAEGERTRWWKVEISLSLNYFIPFAARQEENRLVAGGADAHSNLGWKDMVFSLLKKKNCFYKVTWVYKEKVTACWQSNMDYSLEASQSPNMCPRAPTPRGNYSRYSGLKHFLALLLLFKLGCWK